MLGRVFFDNTLVTGRATSLCTRVCAQSTSGGDGSASLVDQSIFVERSRGRVGDLNEVSIVSKFSTVADVLIDLQLQHGHSQCERSHEALLRAQCGPCQV